MKALYLGLGLLGLVLPGWQIVPWIATHGLDLPLLVAELFSTRIGAFFGLDVIVSAVVVLAFAWSEQRQRRLPSIWPVALATLGVGVSLGLPLLLFLRARAASSTTRASTPGAAPESDASRHQP